MFNQIAGNNAAPNGWLKGVMTFPHRKNARGDIINYRPTTTINMIYKIWTNVMSRRMNPIANLLTEEDQYSYKNKRSPIDILAIANNQLMNNADQQMILFDVSKAFGNIERAMLWAKL